MSADNSGNLHLRELRKLLALLYPHDADQRRLASEAGLTVGAVPLGSSAYNNWHQILHHARHNQGLAALVALALEEFPNNEALQAFAAGGTLALIEGSSFEWRGPSNGRALLERLVSGRESLVHVSHLAKGVQCARSVAKVVLADKSSGTGFLIAGQRLVTNHHVLPDAATAACAHLVFNYQLGPDGAAEATQTFELAPDVHFATNQADDWTVVAVSGDAASTWGQLELSTRPVAVGDLVNIIQHPGGGPKQVSLSFDVVAYVGERRVQYLTDTLPGSSGSPVFDRDWNVVAVHHSGGWLVEPGSPDRRTYYRNQGVLIDCVVKNLRSAAARHS